MEGLFRRIEHLICWPAAAEFWESEILPTRMQSCDAAWLDAILHQADLCGVGSGQRRICFCFEPDLDLLRRKRSSAGRSPGSQGEGKSAEDEMNADRRGAMTSLFAASLTRYDFSARLRLSDLTPAELNRSIWDAVWRGEATNDTFAARVIRHSKQNALF